MIRGRGLATAALAALVTVVVLTVVRTLNGVPPWSSDVRLIGDLSNQTSPMLTYYRDVLTGQANGDLLFAWPMGYGQSFWPNLVMYLANPVYLLVLAFPRGGVSAAIAWIAIANAALGAAAIALLLHRLRPGARPLLVALAVAWGANEYLVVDSGHQPMWTASAWLLPAFALTGLWALRRRRLWSVAPVVALGWWANFYMAWMASLGAAILLAALVLADPRRWSRPWAALWSWTWRAVLGVAGAAVAIIPAYQGVQRGVATAVTPFPWPPNAFDWIAAVVPGASTTNHAPTWSPTLPVLVLALVAGIYGWRQAAVRRRALVWGIAVLLTLITLAVPWTALIWHGGDLPDGNYYRQAWVVTALVIVAAWELCLNSELARAGGAHLWRPGDQSGWIEQPVSLPVGRRIPIVVGVALSALVAAAWLGTQLRALAPVWVAVPLVLLAAWLLSHERRWRTAVFAGLTVAVVLAGDARALSAFRESAAHDMVDFGEVGRYDDLVAQARTYYPGSATGLATTVGLTTNDPLLLGGAGGTSYSTMVPTTLSDTLIAAGYGWGLGGRRLFSLGSPVEDAALGVIRTGGPTDRSQVRWLDAGTADDIRLPGTPARDWPIADLYRDWAGDAAAPAAVRRTAGAAGGGRSTYEVSCPATAGDLAIALKRTPGIVEIGGRVVAQPSHDAFTQAVTTIDRLAGRSARLAFTPQDGDGPPVLLCLAAQPHPLGTPAVSRRDGHTLTIDAPARGSAPAAALVATGYTDEWQCRQGDSVVPTRSRAGLLQLETAGAGSIRCVFEPDGLRLGALVTAGAAALWMVSCLAGVLGARRRRLSSAPTVCAAPVA